MRDDSGAISPSTNEQTVEKHKKVLVAPLRVDQPNHFELYPVSRVGVKILIQRPANSIIKSTAVLLDTFKRITWPDMPDFGIFSVSAATPQGLAVVTSVIVKFSCAPCHTAT